MFNFVFDLLCFAAVLKATNPRSRLGAGAGSPMLPPPHSAVFILLNLLKLNLNFG